MRRAPSPSPQLGRIRRQVFRSGRERKRLIIFLVEHRERRLQLPLGLDLVQRLFHDVGGVERRREGARREILERRRELEDLVHHPVGGPDVVELPIPEGVGRDVRPLVGVLEQVVDLL